MINSKQRALIKKDLRGITGNKRMFSVMLIVPLMMSVFLPSVFIISVLMSQEGMAEFSELLDMMNIANAGQDVTQQMVGLMVNNVLPAFFLMVPIMASSVMAASSFVGEKEKRTLETLLYSPMTLGEIFSAKIMASFLMSMLVSLVSAVTMLIVVNVETMLLAGFTVLPNINWLLLLLLVVPSISIIAITLIVRGSAKAQTAEESQQRSVFLILPVLMLFAGQMTGLFLLDQWILLAVGVVCAAVAWLMLKASKGKFRYEVLLR